jgi:hypothetical protein
MSEASATFAIEDIILPLNLEAVNPEHVHKLEALRDRLVAFLKAAEYSPKHKDSSNPNPFRENLLTNFAKLLIKEKLVDGDGELVSVYDACDLVAWLYHGFKWLNAAVCEQYNKADGKAASVMGFTKTVVDGTAVIKYTTFDHKTKTTKTIDAPSKYTNVDWSAWSGPQMIDPLQLRLSTHVTSHKKALYGFFTPTPKNPGVATFSDHVAVAATTLKKPKSKKTAAATGVSGGGAGSE